MELTQEIVRELIDYDPATGICRWKYRDVKWFKGGRKKPEYDQKHWNGKYNGIAVGWKNPSGYFTVTLFGKYHLLHRIIWLYMVGELPNIIDHIDGDPSNNKWDNLRSVDSRDNMRNRKMSANNTSGIMGVVWDKTRGKWRSAISVKRKNVHLGRFACIAHAVRARKEAEIKYGFHPNHGRK